MFRALSVASVPVTLAIVAAWSLSPVAARILEFSAGAVGATVAAYAATEILRATLQAGERAAKKIEKSSARSPRTF